MLGHLKKQGLSYTCILKDITPESMFLHHQQHTASFVFRLGFTAFPLFHFKVKEACLSVGKAMQCSVEYHVTNHGSLC
jgi:hypothetical protein